MSTVPKINEFLKSVTSVFKDKHLNQVRFGFQSISIQPLISLNSNARSSIGNQHTAESKIFRLCHNERLLEAFPKLLSVLDLVSDNDLVNVDFSDFGDGKQVLMFAKQTKDGRALPLYFETLQYPIKDGSQNLFIVEVVEHFFKLLQVQVSLVFDRGFAVPYLIKKLLENKHVFYIRIKKDKRVKQGQKSILIKAKELKTNDEIVEAYDVKLRITRSDLPGNQNDPWHIITNDFVSSRAELLSNYYHRFEIEEFFKDTKRFFRLEFLRTKTIRSFSIVLWFVILGSWLAWYLHRAIADGRRLARKIKHGFTVSIIQSWFEKILLEIRSAFLQAIIIEPHGRL